MGKYAETREVGDVKIVVLKGKITIGTGDIEMRESIQALLDGGSKKIIVDMAGVSTIDSSGIGELVGCYTKASNRGAKLKLMNLTQKTADVLTVTKLITVFDVYHTEGDAIASF
jgi:anti-sigma B factor antagonist